ncbi:MAG: hypothetical protein EXS03_02340 [Phycisphaerales bacterium]|nr:hypothetical protein [Phycisphaerales bacterium]
MNRQEREREEVRVGWRMMGLAWGFVTQMLAGALLGLGVGVWLGDETMGALFGTGTGLVVATYFLLRGGLRLNRELDRIAAQQRNSSDK